MCGFIKTTVLQEHMSNIVSTVASTSADYLPCFAGRLSLRAAYKCVMSMELLARTSNGLVFKKESVRFSNQFFQNKKTNI